MLSSVSTSNHKHGLPLEGQTGIHEKRLVPVLQTRLFLCLSVEIRCQTVNPIRDALKVRFELFR